MSAPDLSCSACGAPVPDPGADGEGRCGICHARYRVADGRAYEIPAETRPARHLAGMIGVGVAVLVLLAAAVTFFGRSDPDPALVSDGPGVPNPLDTTVDALDPNAKASADFRFHHVRKGADHGLIVFGEVLNTSGTIDSRPDVVAVLRDAKGAELARATGSAEREFLLPRATSPVQIRFENAPAYAEITYEVSVDKATNVPVYAPGLIVAGDAPTLDAPGQLVFQGEVKNTGPRAARFVHVEVLALDAEQRILGIESAYAKEDLLRPGEASRFRIVGTPVPEPVAQYSLSATGRAAD